MKNIKKCSNATALIYDSKLDRYAVAMTGGGMDLSPHLLDTFINLGKGVPISIAENIRKDYNAYVDREKHLKNCKLLSEAFKEMSERYKEKSEQLKN